MDGAMGQEEDVVEAVLTCEGDFHDPELNSRIERFRHRLKDLLLTEKQRLQVKKIEPWNSVKVTFTIPREAALRLRQLAQTGNDALRQMGVLSVQIQGDTQISLTIAGRNNESTQLVLCTPPTTQVGNSSLPLSTESGIKNSEELESSQSSSNDELTRKNIVQYLRQGSVLRQNQALFDTILGAGTSSVPVLGFGLDIPQPMDSIPGPSGSNTIFRPNNIATSALQSQTVGGSHLNSSFPFTTTGAFHPPVPRVPFSAGQRSATNSTHHIQPGNISSGRLMGPLGHDPLLNTHPSLSDVGLDGHVFQHNMNSFSPVGAIKHSPAITSTTMSSMSLHASLPSSPTSSFMIDLPPPPPYPSGSNISRQGKPVTSSSPLLVNLLQTDPLTAAVGLASGNPNKPMTTGELSSNSPLKKKQQSKKTKDGLMKPYLFRDNPASNRTGAHIHLLSSDIDLDRSNTRIPEDTFTSVDLIQSRLGLHPASHILDSFITTSLPDSRSLFSSDHPISESPPLEEFHTDLNRRSAVGAGCSSSKISDSNGKEQFSSDLDPFIMEIAAGKIINPYTGQLEPRDSFVDNVQVRANDQTSHSQGDHFATHMLARKAKELKKVHENRVPDLPSKMLDSHVWKTAVPTHINVATSAAAFVHSSGPLQASSGKLTSISSHRRNIIGDGSPRETKDSSFSSSVYAVTGKPWQEVDSDTDVAVKVSSNTLTNSSSRKMPSALSASLHKNFTPTPVPFNGQTSGGQAVRHNVNPSQHHHVAVSSSSSGLRLSPQGSVIYSSVTKSSSLPLLPVSHNSYVTQTQSQQLVPSTATNHLTAPSKLQMSVPNTAIVSLPISHPSRLGSTSFSSSQPPLVTERLKTDPSHVLNQHIKAASSDIAEGSTARQNNPPNLLKSLPNKHLDPQNNTSSPPDNKPSSEGDENSNHSGLITDTLPEHSGTAALLEHSGVKAENHDSGVGSSSERSDDTPSEPGDSEFRSGHVGSEIEDTNKASLQKTVNCKLNSKINSSANTITVGYMVSPNDSSAQSKSIHLKDSGHTSKSSALTSASPATVADISQFFQAHIMSMDKQTGLLTGGPQMSVSMSVEGGKVPSHPSFTGKIRENGQGFDDMDNSATLKLNGPSSQSNIEKMIKTMSDLQHKKSRSSPKQNNVQALMDMPSEHLRLQTEVLEKMSKLHQFAESTKDTSDVLTKPNSSDKSESPDALSQRLIVSEDRPDQLIFDLDELVNGKTVGHGGGGAEVKGGSNITSIYSKRSSPVNVNMLNHIYAPGLPLPRRLTESVQRLVKPLPASETSVSYPQVRPCKSPGSGGSPRAGSGINIQSSPRMSGVRSPGASTPKLLPSDKHSLLSGGLDLAGFPNIKHTPSVSPDQPELATALANCKRRSPALTADVLLLDPHCFPISQNSPPNLLLDSKSYSGKMLSQSFPPHKSREFKPNITHMNHGLILSLQSNSSVFEKGLSPSVHTTHHCQLPRSKGESLQSTSQDSRFYPSNRSHQDIWQSNHVSSVPDTGQARQAPQQSLAADNTHSTNNSHAVETSSAYTSHSNASSPVMPVLQRGLEPPGTPTVASSMPNISSQPFCSISSLKEISVFSIGSSLSLTDASVSSQNKHVPYSNNIVGTSGTAVNVTAKSPPVSTSIPLLTPVSAACPSGLTEDLSSYPAPPRLSLSALDVSSSTKMKRTTPNNPSPSSRNGSNTPQFSRNLFESVSGTLTHDNISTSKMELASNNSGDSFSHGSSRLTAYGSDSKSDSFSSALVSQESKGDLMVKNMRNKSSDSVEKRVVSHYSSKTDLNKISTASKSKQTSRDLSLSTFLSTEVVNLDFSVPLQACNAISLNIGANKGTSKIGSAVKTNYSASGDVQENASLHTIQSYTSSISSVSHNSSGLSWTLDNIAEVTSSVAAGKEEAALKFIPGLSISNTPSVKEPILEILASALESSMTKTSVAASGKSFVKKQAPICSTSLEFHQVEEDTTTEGRMVTIQSGPNKPPAISHHQVSLELSEPAADQSSDPFSRRLGKKRKSTNSEDETDASSVEFTPVNQPHSSHSPIRSTSKSPIADIVPTQIDSPSKPDGADSTEVQDEKSHTLPKSPTAVIREPLEKDTKKSVMAALGTKQEDKDTQRNTYKSRGLSASDNTEQVSNTESRPHRSLTSGTDSSDEGPSNRSSSNESRDSTYRESRFHRNAIASTADSRERRAHRAGTASAATDDKDLPKDGHSSKLSVDHLENSHRDIRSHRSTSDTTDEKDDNKESRTQRSSSADDKDKTKSGKDIAAEKSGNWDTANTDSKLDEAHKKSHRIRRQFYAYVPEKSIDQTYFDTPILSSRTRSRNKPSDKPGSDTASGQDEAVPAASAGESQAHHSIGGGLQAATAKADGSAESTGGKRPMRSVRARDNSQDQNPSKRRRVQQQR